MRRLSLLVACGLLAMGPATPLLAQSAIKINNTNATEGNTGAADAVLTVSLTTPATGVVTVDFATENEAATGGVTCGGSADFVIESGTVQFDPGETSQPVGIAVCGDDVVESNEAFKVRLSNASGATIQDAEGRVTINTDDAAAPPQPSLSIGDATVVEGTGTTSMLFTATLSAVSTQVVNVAFATSPVSAVQGASCVGVDLLSVQGSLTFGIGVTSRPLNVTVCGDLVDEPNETFDVVLSNPAGATLADGTGRGTITDDDAPDPRVEDQSVDEGTGSPSVALVPVTLSSSSAELVIVRFNLITDATATAKLGSCATGDDLPTNTTDVQFLPGETTKTVSLTICGDALVEDDERIKVVVTPTSPPGPGSDTAFLTIRNDDFLPTLTINDVTFVEGSAVNAVLTVTLSLPAPAAIQLTASTAPQAIRIPRAPAATSGLVCGGPADFRALVAQFPIPAGATSVSIPVQICDDAVVEGPEGLSVTIQPVSGLTIGDGLGIIRITDND
jgi:hypothetical protein